ncbi:hypothetical protein NBRC3188_3090 [Acetobacter pasteurianus NBRC 3188]|uniref:Uncharacterized protein n=1 Tax=Acetobacter pasteurianus NBRC 3188 TaxID=1226663 RepID=A0A401WYK6_ACEPA|nr:hypothetical protein NBRC3188_3090 [Acetobacter pasteurianus NBRC 3188]
MIDGTKLSHETLVRRLQSALLRSVRQVLHLRPQHTSCGITDGHQPADDPSMLGKNAFCLTCLADRHDLRLSLNDLMEHTPINKVASLLEVRPTCCSSNSDALTGWSDNAGLAWGEEMRVGCYPVQGLRKKKV